MSWENTDYKCENCGTDFCSNSCYHEWRKNKPKSGSFKTISFFLGIVLLLSSCLPKNETAEEKRIKDSIAAADQAMMDASQNQNPITDESSENANNESQSDQYNIYYPITPEGNYDKSELSLYYYPNINGNKPYAEFRFIDGTIFKLKPNCEGEYSWCIRSIDNVEIGFLKIETDTEGEAVFLDIKFNENSSSYSSYLSKMTGTFRSI